MTRRLRALVFMYNSRRYGESFGGAERRILQFSKFADMEIHFLEKQPGFARFYSSQPFHLAWIPSSRMRIPAQVRALIWALTAFLSALHLNRKFKFDLFASHDPEFWNVLPLFLTSKLTGCPSIAYLHHTERIENDAPARTFMDFYRYFRRLGYHMLSSVLSAFEKRVSITFLKQLDGLLAVSSTTKHDFVNRGVPQTKVAVVDNGIDLNYFSTFRRHEKIYDIAYLGRISPRKGLDDILYVAKNMSKKAIIIGSGTPYQVERYRNLAKSIQDLEFPGFLPDHEAYSLIASSKLFLFPSYEEGFGLVIGEAIALGVPVVCYDVPSLIEVWNGAVRFVRTGEKQTLKEEVLSLLNNEKKRNELAQKAIRVIKKYDWQEVAPHETTVLRNIVGRRKP